MQDLQLRKGFIRCVQCAHIFDGYAEVVSGPGEVPSGLPSRPGQRIDPAPVTPAISPSPYLSDNPLDGPQVFRASRRGREEPHFIDTDIPADESQEPFLGQQIPRGAPEPRRVDIDDTPFIAPAAAAPGRVVIDPHPGRISHGGSAAPLMRAQQGGGWFAGVGSALSFLALILLLVLLLAQLLYIYRSQIALAAPALRPAIERLCQPLQCRVPYARDLSVLSISGSALRADAQTPLPASGGGEAVAANGPAKASSAAVPAKPRQQSFVLNVNLRNAGDHPQEWPTIVLDLNDSSGTRLVRRNLSPHDYLRPEQLAAPFAAHSDILVRVPLVVTDVQVNGYQLDLFFP